MKKLILLPIAVLLFACNSSSEPSTQEKAKADQESDSIANAANAFLNDTTTQDTTKTK